MAGLGGVGGGHRDVGDSDGVACSTRRAADHGVADIGDHAVRYSCCPSLTRNGIGDGRRAPSALRAAETGIINGFTRDGGRLYIPPARRLFEP